jgi:hypothetical protein
VTRDRAVFLGILAIALAAGALPAVHERRVPESAVAGRPIQLEGDGYVSSATCQACHPSQYASWHRSYHRTMTQLVTPGTVLAGVNGVLERRGQEVWAEFDDPDRDGGGTEEGRRRVGYGGGW